MRRATIFLALFVMAGASEILSLALDWSVVHWLAKPLIVLALFGYYRAHVEKPNRVFTFALFFCWAGDLLLLFHGEAFFISGLLAFLAGHILYILSYRRWQWQDSSLALLPTQKVRFSFPIILAGTGLIAVLFPRLGDLVVPVIVYAIVLMVMVTTALFRYGRTNASSFWLVFGGAALFMLSDSLLAINKFRSPLPFGGILVMSTYIAAQIMIVRGVLDHKART